MRVLVTGHGGFIGRHIWDAFSEHDRVGIDPVCDGLADVRDMPSLLHGAHFDLVVHCAALVQGRETIETHPALLGAYNLQLDGALFEWALRARPGRIVYLSSSAAYPTTVQNNGRRLLREDLGWGIRPDQTYGWVKLTGELLAEEMRRAGVPVTVVRPFSGYGSDQAECYPFAAMMARARRCDDPFAVWGDGRQVRDFVHVDDIVGAILALIKHEVDGPVNIGTGIGTSMDELARLAMRTAGYEAPIEHLFDKPAGVRYRVADTTVLHRYYEPKVTLAEGVRRALS